MARRRVEFRRFGLLHEWEPIDPLRQGDPFEYAVLSITRLVSASAPSSDPNADISATGLTYGYSDTNGTSFATASVTPSANKLLLLDVASTRDTLDPSAPTVTGNGLTWVQVATTPVQTSGAIRRTITKFRTLGATPTAGAITIDFGAETQTACTWSLAEFANMDISGTSGSGAIVQSVASNSADANAASFTVSLAAFGGSQNATYGAFAVNGGGTDDIQAGSGFSELYDVASTTPTVRLMSEFRASPDTSVDASLTSSSLKWGGIAVEIKRAT